MGRFRECASHTCSGSHQQDQKPGQKAHSGNGDGAARARAQPPPPVDAGAGVTRRAGERKRRGHGAKRSLARPGGKTTGPACAHARTQDTHPTPHGVAARALSPCRPLSSSSWAGRACRRPGIGSLRGQFRNAGTCAARGRSPGLARCVGSSSLSADRRALRITGLIVRLLRPFSTSRPRYPPHRDLQEGASTRAAAASRPAPRVCTLSCF